MNSVISAVAWLNRGRQRRAIARVLRSPMTSSQIWDLARVLAPRILLRDVWFGLRQLSEQGLVFCLNPTAGNGRVFFPTEFGRTVVEAGFGTSIEPLPPRTNWNCFSKVVRAQVRRGVLEEIGRSTLRASSGKSISEVRRNLLLQIPMELSRAIRAVSELVKFGLIRVAGTTPKPKRKLYALTPAGRKVVDALRRCSAAPAHAARPGDADVDTDKSSSALPASSAAFVQ